MRTYENKKTTYVNKLFSAYFHKLSKITYETPYSRYENNLTLFYNLLWKYLKISAISVYVIIKKYFVYPIRALVESGGLNVCDENRLNAYNERYIFECLICWKFRS